jgi:formate hydrogenlyase subunit 3/multisubunit Na+/H+ antiporter MnhD subunit
MSLKTFIEWSGWVAALLILGSYGLLSFGKIQARSPLYQWMNLVGAVGFVINCSWNGAWPSVALNVVWGAIALYSMKRNSRLKQPV